MIENLRKAWRGAKVQDLSWVPGPPSDEGQLPVEEEHGVFVPRDADEVKRQTDLVRTAIAQGGRLGDHEIAIPWLRKLLAGLEGRPIDEEAMWDGIATPPRREPVEESPAYRELFPARS